MYIRSNLLLLCVQASSEYDELPVRHNEDGLNRSLSALLPLPVEPPESFESPHTKTHLLLQAHFSRAELPIADYATDTKSVLDQALRILQVHTLISSFITSLVAVKSLLCRFTQCIIDKFRSQNFISLKI